MFSRRARTADVDPTAGEFDVRGGRDLTVPIGYWDELERAEEIAAAARSRRVPLTMAGVTLLVAASAWGLTRLVAVFGGPDVAGLVGALVWLGTWAAVPVLRASLRARIAEEWARTWWVSTALAAIWVDIVVAVGAAMVSTKALLWLVAALVIGTAVMSARWNDEHEVPDPGLGDAVPEEDAPDLVPAVAVRVPQIDARAAEAEGIERDWDARVAAGKRPIAPGSELLDREQLANGWRWTVQLDRDESITRTALENDGVTADVALRLGMSSTHVVLERLPDDNREHLAQLTIVTRDVLAGGVPYRGPRYDRGLIPIGDYADGSPDAPWRSYDATGVLCGLITGGQGSGKSALMAALGLALRRSGEWVVLFGDGDEGGNSSHLLAEVAHDFARGPAEVLEQLEGLEAMAQVRGTLMGTLTPGQDGTPTQRTTAGQRPVAKMLPCPTYPGIVWIVDEFYRLANDPGLQRVNFVDRVEAVVRIMRKYGGCVIVGTQSALGDDFDGNSALRGMLASGNTVALRTKNKSEQGIVTDGFAPSQLPKGGGYAFLGEGDRRAMIRTEHPDGMPQWVPDVVRYGRPDVRSWAAFRRYRQVRELDAGAEYAEQMAKLAAFDEAVATGAPLPWDPDAAETEVPGEGPVSIAGFTVPTLADVIPFRRTEPDEQQDATPVPDESPLSKNARTVLDDVRAHPGPQKSADIIARTSLTDSAVSRALAELRRHGLVHRPSGVRGVHEAGPGEINNEEAV